MLGEGRTLALSFALLAACARANSSGHVSDAPPGDAPKGAADAMADAPASAIAVTIAPAMPRTLDDLVATVAATSETYTLRWTKNHVPQPVTGATVSNTLTTKGELWGVDVVDGLGSLRGHAEVTILNTPPSAPTAALPAGPAPGASIQCGLAMASTDADGDPITYTAQWTRNAAAFTQTVTAAFASDTVPSGVSAVGDTFGCVVVASDGTDTSASPPVSTQPTCVGHAPPAVTFPFIGSTQTYQVPPCASQLQVEVWGAQGGGPQGGLGGYARGTLAVTAGQTLFVYVGGANGFNGGGAGMASANVPNGGGASDVRGGAGQLADRIIVAGGGGGGPTVDQAWAGGTGGGGTCGANYCGGGPGNGYGGTGGSQALAQPGGAAGGAAFQTAHGGGGGGGGLTSGGGGSCQTFQSPATCGGTGVLGVGGDGAGGGNSACYSSYGGTAGGGGGYYGGGGTAVGFCGGGAGGGGSSWTGTLTNPVLTAGVQAGNGKVTITPM